jgi:hypothetical protein
MLGGACLVELGGWVQALAIFFLVLLGKRLVIEHRFEYNGCMELGDPTAAEREQRSVLAVALDTLEAALTEVIEKIEAGGLDQLSAAEKISWWRRFETFRNRLPLIDHSLIADAEATDLPATSCSSSLTGFWCRCCNSPPVRQPPESALQQPWGPRTSMFGGRS